MVPVDADSGSEENADDSSKQGYDVEAAKTIPKTSVIHTKDIKL